MTAHVLVKFEGLMVFHRSRTDSRYEVGILEGGAHHTLGIAHTQTGTLQPITQAQIKSFKGMGNHWQLDVIDRKGVDIVEVNVGHRDRHDTTPDGRQFDFDWMIDLESDAFHGPIGEQMVPGQLKPIFRLSHGRLSTYCKTFKLKRRKGLKGKESSFGFMTETIALSIDFNAGEKVVLRVNKSGGGFQEVFCLEHRDGFTHRVNIINLAPDAAGTGRPGDPSHFQLYYKFLFPGIADSDKFEIRAPKHPVDDDFPPNGCIVRTSKLDQGGHKDETGEGHNVDGLQIADDEVVTSVNPFVCGAIRLSRRESDLK